MERSTGVEGEEEEAEEKSGVDVEALEEEGESKEVEAVEGNETSVATA